jgi:hypothetical protein
MHSNQRRGRDGVSPGDSGGLQGHGITVYLCSERGGASEKLGAKADVLGASLK